MSTEQVGFRIPKEMKTRIHKLVNQGIYTSTGDFCREAIREKLAQYQNKK